VTDDHAQEADVASTRLAASPYAARYRFGEQLVVQSGRKGKGKEIALLALFNL